MKEEIIHSDKNVYAILSDEPLSYGHVLVIPKRHVERLEELSASEVTTLFLTIRNFIPRLLKAVQARDYNLFINAGSRANQGVFHLHVHIVPRRSSRNHLDVFFDAFAEEESRQLSKEARKRVAGSIRKRMIFYRK